MNTHLEKCQACGSREMRNIHVKEEGEPEGVYVQCAGCDALVAYYTLRSRFHHGREVESFLQSAGSSAVESGRRLLVKIQTARDKAEEGYIRALEDLKKNTEKS